MTEVERKGIGKAKVSLGVVLVIILAISSVWLYTMYACITLMYNELQGEVEYWRDDADYWYSVVDDLNDEVDSLTTKNEDLSWEILSINAPQLHRVADSWNDNHPLDGSPYVNYHGSIFNSGSETAYSIVINVRIYDGYDTLLKTEEIHLGNIEDKSYQTFDVDIEYSGDADRVTSALTYD